MNFEDSTTMNSQEFVDNVDNQYVELEDERVDFEEYFRQDDAAHKAVQETILEDQNPYTKEQLTEKTEEQDDYNNFNDNIGNNDTGHHYSNKNSLDNDDFETELPDDSENNDQAEKVTDSTEIELDTKDEESLQTETKGKAVKTKKSKKNKKKDFEKITLSLEEQKADLDKRRKEKKYMEAEFKCSSCAIGFFFKDTYQTHMMRHEESNGEYRCQTCTLRFATPDVLRAHYKNHSVRFACARCGERVTQRARNTHARNCWRGNDDRVACHLCANMFQDAYGLNQHLKRFHKTKTGNKTYPCSVCGKTYNNQAAVRTHMMYVWSQPTPKEVSPDQDHRSYPCSVCGKTYNNQAAVRTHMMYVWSHGLNQHLKRFHKTKTGNKTYPYSVCGKTYNNQAAVRTHMIKHINRKFNCSDCPATFSSPYTLAQHKKKKHSGVTAEQFYCEICNTSYGSRKSLLAHKRNALNHQQTIFECPICSRVSPNELALLSHIESVHSHSKNYACPQCTARYSNRKSLVRHIGTHNGKKPPKRAVCHNCGATFKGNNKLNRHLREVCDKSKLEELAQLYEQSL